MKCRPSEHLSTAGELYPDTWRLIESFRISRGKEIPAC